MGEGVIEKWVLEPKGYDREIGKTERIYLLMGRSGNYGERHEGGGTKNTEGD